MIEAVCRSWPNVSKRKVQPIEKTDHERDDLVGYARVSTEEQNLDMQVAALRRAGVRADAIHTEKTSGVALRRPGRDIAVKMCREGDTLVVWKLDRIGRSLYDLLTFMRDLEAKGINFWSLQDSIDTKTPAGRVMLAMLGAFAQFERDLIAERTRAGVARAKERGVKFGRESKLTPAVRKEFERRYRAGESVPEIAVAMKISEPTFRRVYNGPMLAELRKPRKS